MFSPNGAPCSLTNVASMLYPETAQEMKKFYLLSVSSPFTNNVSGLGTPDKTVFGIKTVADEEKDYTAAQGLAKLNLFNDGAALDYIWARLPYQSMQSLGH